MESIFVDLSAYSSNISVRVQAETGTSFTSDMAVDLLQFMELPTVGYTNPLADNYDSTAVIDDGSCYFSNCSQLTLNMYDSWGDGWNGNDSAITGSNGTTFFTTTLSGGSFEHHHSVLQIVILLHVEEDLSMEFLGFSGFIKGL